MAGNNRLGVDSVQAKLTAKLQNSTLGKSTTLPRRRKAALAVRHVARTCLEILISAIGQPQ